MYALKFESIYILIAVFLPHFRKRLLIRLTIVDTKCLGFMLGIWTQESQTEIWKMNSENLVFFEGTLMSKCTLFLPDSTFWKLWCAYWWNYLITQPATGVILYHGHVVLDIPLQCEIEKNKFDRDVGMKSNSVLGAWYMNC